jgi:hypothetical protein
LVSRELHAKGRGAGEVERRGRGAAPLASPSRQTQVFLDVRGAETKLVKYGRSQFLVFDDLTEGVIDFSALKKFQSAFRDIRLPDTRGNLDNVLVQPTFAVSTNVADPATLFKPLPQVEDCKRCAAKERTLSAQLIVCRLYCLAGVPTVLFLSAAGFSWLRRRTRHPGIRSTRASLECSWEVRLTGSAGSSSALSSRPS